MKEIKIDLENCYGIKKLKKEFEFSKTSKVYSIYAPNGVMKTSFSKVFKKYQKWEEGKICDEMFKNRKPKYNILGIKDYKENIFVIEPYAEWFESKKITTLLLKDDLKKKYEDEYLKIEESENNFYESLKEKSGIKNSDNIKKELLDSFWEKDIFDVILTQESKVLDWKTIIFDEIIYEELFNWTALTFLENEKDIIEDYINRYDKLVIDSKYLWKDFNHYKAKKTWDTLGKMSFFKWWHKIWFFDKIKKSFDEILDEKWFLEKIEKDEEILLNDPKIRKILEKLDKKIKNAKLERLRDYLFNNKSILVELKNLEFFRKKLWIDYFKVNIIQYEDLLLKIKSWKKEIEKILTEASSDKEYWNEAIEEFNSRFTVPFKLDVKNIEDILTKGIEPQIDFIFEDIDTKEIAEISKSDLLEILSQWEKRALYLLNIIFEIISRKRLGIETLFIIDDIADSFDYKNKYAIIQYLKDISEEDIFYQIILTHNFDFFRTIQSRKIASYKNCLFTLKWKDWIDFEKAEWINNIFINDWKVNLLKSKRKLIASITFIRNIIEYTRWETDSDYLILTSLLHSKKDTKNILISDIESIYNNIFNKSERFLNRWDTFFKLLEKEADEILIEPIILGINLENKNIFFIIIRILSEDFMKNKITDWKFLSLLEWKKMQTWRLFAEYKKEFGLDILEKENIKIITEMMIMTPENIHLNSFMYEPILDMSDEHLKKLYKRVRDDLK